jgi:hypothetical protein
MERDQLREVLDFILNNSSDEEFEVIVQAVQRRQKDRHIYQKIGGVRPQQAAKVMARDIEANMGGGLDGLRSTVRNYVEDIIRKNAPGISEDELKTLVEHYTSKAEAEAQTQAVSNIPPEAELTMVKQFVSYSTGAMAPSEQKYLWDEMPNWKEDYWKRFRPEVKAFVNALLTGKMELEPFWAAIYSVLGL